MKRIWNGITFVSLAWGFWLIAAGLWQAGREIANRKKIYHN